MTKKLLRPDRYSNTATVGKRYGRSRSTIWRWCKEFPEFPKPKYIGNQPIWDNDELDTHNAKLETWEERFPQQVSA